MMKRWLLIGLFIPLGISAQELDDFNSERLRFDKNLMLGLGAWSVTNFAVSGYGWATTKNEAKYFHQMNVFWNGVNIALALPGYLKARNTSPLGISFGDTWKAQNKTEKVFLFNTALDLFYITGGFYLKQRALLDTQNYHRYRGWGNSLVMQGSFLFLFDLTAYIIHSRHRKNKLSPFLDKVELSDVGLGFKYKL